MSKDMKFELHPQLQLDCIVLGSFELSLLLLVKDSQYPWFILVPKRDGIKEIFELSEEDQSLLLKESSILSKALQQEFKADKMNLAALGNMVPQLHLHHVVRYKDDAAWPGPIWGVKEALPYSEADIEKMTEQVKNAAIEGLELKV